MKRRIVAALALLAALALCALGALGEAQENLLANGGFEALNAQGDPTGWYVVSYRSQTGTSRLAATDEKAHSGQYSAVIENASLNDARLTCTAKVEPQSLYRLSGYVLVERMEAEGNGANLAIEGIYASSEAVRDTGGEWKYLEWYGETGDDQTEVTFGARVGGYSAESVGKAYFDDIALTKVDALPDDAIADLWYNPNKQTVVSAQTDDAGEPQKSTGWFLACGLAFFAACWLCRKGLNARGSAWSGRRATLLFAALMALALVPRVLLGVNVAGFPVDINCFRSWSARMAEVGPANFYAEGYFCDYPPGGMLLLWPVGLMLNAAGAQSAGLSLLIVKLLPILCDLLGALLLYRCAVKRLGGLPALLLAALYLFNPAVLVNGAAWGQVDSVLALLIALTALYATEKRWRVAIPLFFVSALVKPQAILFAPIGGMWLIFTLVRDKEARRKAWRDILIGVGVAAAASAAIVAPFAVGKANPVGWLAQLYGDTLGSYARATLNTANLYYLVGANWTELTEAVPAALPAVTAFAALALAATLVLRARRLTETGKRWLTSKRGLLALICLLLAVAMVVMWLAGADYAAYGYAMMAFAYAFAILCMWLDGRAEALPFYMALALVGVYVLGVKVHERYLFPALLLLLVGYARTRDRRLLWLLAGFSVTTFVNTAVILDNALLYGSARGHLNSDTLALNVALCVANLALTGFAFWVGVTGPRESRPLPAAEERPDEQPPALKRLLAPGDARLRLTLRDWLVMLIASALYAVLAFANLGSAVAPQRAWVSTSPDEQVVLSLPESSTFKVLYYAGVSYNPFSIAVSEDGVQWSDDFPCQMREGLCYQWCYALQSDIVDGKATYAKDDPEGVLWLVGKYLRVNAEAAGLNLMEICARDADGNDLPLTLVSQTNAQPDLLDEPKPAANLVDEPNTCVGEPGWYNSMYFDEIYHARTAYEHLHGESTYEWTHPPLGKLLIAGGIALFGMVPFGWRFAGAFIGVLMLPALYLLGLQLTKRRGLAAFSMLAFALDLMHYAQTRIATIDSFPVFFIILMYLCMVRYLQTDVFAVGAGERQRLFTRAYRKSLVPLGLCGAFMGLSIASKWIGLYSAVGLAVLFFAGCWRQYRAGLAASAIEPDAPDSPYAEEELARIRSAREYALKRILVTCGFCVLFFIVVPCVIYFVSYIPQLAPTGPVTVKRIVDVQKNMLNYHSKPGLGMDHPFQSPWWQWPLIMKPIWFVQDSFEPEGYASTIFCMGNPWVFAIGAACMLAVLAAFAVKCARRRDSLRQGGDDWLTLGVLSVGFLAQYLPWTLVPRSMYMYHYFASVPFIILATAWAVGRIPERRRHLRGLVMGVYLAGAAALFVLYFPYASGWLTPVSWLETAKSCFRPKLLELITTGEVKRFLTGYFKLYY